MSRPAGGIDQVRFSQANVAIAGAERAIEDEFLDELWRLQQRVLLLGLFLQVLVEVAEEARLPAASVNRGRAPCFRIDLPPERNERLRRIGRHRPPKEWIVLLVE